MTLPFSSAQARQLPPSPVSIPTAAGRPRGARRPVSHNGVIDLRPRPYDASAAGGPTAALDAQDPRVIDQLWKEYKASGARDVRDRLIVHYSPLVKYVAGRV
ncbi:MAG: hypothetical protein M3N68_09700, partial [Actinomycetota bacterium]|nr:hypothetical protein [Actinomycetota bacterium]